MSDRKNSPTYLYYKGHSTLGRSTFYHTSPTVYTGGAANSYSCPEIT